jgi:hypothetical protein
MSIKKIKSGFDKKKMKRISIDFSIVLIALCETIVLESVSTMPERIFGVQSDMYTSNILTEFHCSLFFNL